VLEGGYMPLALGGLVMLLMYTWRRGSRLLSTRRAKQETPLRGLVAMLEKKPPVHVPGTAVFLTSDPTSAPTALMHSLKHYKVLHEKNVILTIETADTPTVKPDERVQIEQIGENFSCVTLHFGYMETPNVPKALAIARKLGWQFDIMSTSFSCRGVRSSPRRIPACRAGRTACSSACAERQRRDGLFPDSDRPGGRDRHASRDLTKDILRLRFARQAILDGVRPFDPVGEKPHGSARPRRCARPLSRGRRQGAREGTMLLVDVRDRTRRGRALSRSRRLHADVGIRSVGVARPGGKQVVFACRSGNRSVTAR